MNVIGKRRVDEGEGEGNRVDLTEENRRLKKENERLLELLTYLNEEMHGASDFWRNAYLSLAISSGAGEKRMGK